VIESSQTVTERPEIKIDKGKRGHGVRGRTCWRLRHIRTDRLCQI